MPWTESFPAEVSMRSIVSMAFGVLVLIGALSTAGLSAVSFAAAHERAPQDRAKQVQALAAQGKTNALRQLGEKTIPHIVALFQADKHRKTLLQVLVESKSPEARKVLEGALAAATSNDDIFMTARALGIIKHAGSKKALLDRRASFPRPEPDEGGIAFGGDTDWAHLMLIWSVARIEGQDFGGLPARPTGEDALHCTLSAEEVTACLQWWREYRIKLKKSP